MSGLFKNEFPLTFLNSNGQLIADITAIANTLGVSEGCKESWNVSVVLISWRPPAVRVHWHFTPTNYSVARFELTYRPLNARYRVIHDIPGEQRSLVLERLQPATEYQLYLVAFALSGQPTNISGKVHFVSPDATQNDSWSQKVGQDPDAGAVSAAVPLTPRHRQAQRLPLNDALAPLERFNLEFGAANTPYHLHKMRPRQNSVFVGSPYRSRSGSMLSEPRMPRKVKSAEDLKSLVIQVGDRTLQQSTAL
ncbi:hypothetical protein HNY73_017491 [Argiope bruennichi]|uniref:Fibronectin type-III domain-containing protein n=1 Tax=Argiope bruennichi TaxID=94029 RepID=A0A8T0EA40_ARGBR|nr:hypothetical protein HNY73_017491 [Argiope bruennichi]